MSFNARLVLLMFAMVAVSGCASSGDTAAGPSRFSNFLVIGVAGNYDSRAQFERVVASGLRAEGVAARPYHLVAGDNKPLVREDVLAAIEQHGFDAVVVTRVLDTDSDVELRSAVTGQKVKRKEAGFMKLFRYDYEELGDPLDLTVNMQVDFVTELYSSATQDLVWSAETKGPKSDHVAVLVDETGKLVVRQLRRAGKLAR